METREYIELWVALTPQNEDLWSNFCFEEGASGIENMEENDSEIQVRVFFEEQGADFVQALIPRFCAQFQISDPAIRLLKVEVLPYEDWQSGWKDYFLPINVGKSFTVCPPWSVESVPSERTPIIIDPGQGFGTGYHPSTVVALETLERVIMLQEEPPDSLADVGTGSGILSLAAARLGVPTIHGVDIEEEAVEDVLKNQELNGFKDHIQAWTGGPELLTLRYSIVISNMLCHELLGVKEDLVRLVAPTGLLICSGLLEEQKADFQATFQKLNMRVLDTIENEGWRALILRQTL